MADNKIFIGTLDRFGYELRVVTNSEEEARKLLMKEYKKTFETINHYRPTKEYINTAEDELFIEEVTLGKVEWV